jgi:8-oxo-dGTP diphosphatase
MTAPKRRGETAWLAAYDPFSFPPFVVTVDLAIFTLRRDRLEVLLVERGGHPFRGYWALPGGHVKQAAESVEAAAERELAEETGIGVAGAYLEQLATYSAPTRDPRMQRGLQVVTVAFVALVPDLEVPTAGSNEAAAKWWPVDEVVPAAGDGIDLAFDHKRIVRDALQRVRAKLEYTTLAGRFLAEPFSLADLRHVYRAVWGSAPDLANFRRKVLSTAGFVVPTDNVGHASRGGRPAVLYRRGLATYLDPPIRRATPGD